MKQKNILTVLIIALAVSVAAYFYFRNKAQAKAKELAAGNGAAATDTGGGTGTPGVLIVNGYPLKKGSVSDTVKLLQVVLDIDPDGVFGKNTEAALIKKMNVKAVGLEDLYLVCRANVNPQQKEFPLIKGGKNKYVKAVQIIKGLKTDGLLGNSTIAALGGNALNVMEYNEMLKAFLKSKA